MSLTLAMLCLKKKFQLSQWDAGWGETQVTDWKNKFADIVFQWCTSLSKETKEKGKTTPCQSWILKFHKIAWKHLALKAVPSCDENQANLTITKGLGCKEKISERILSPGIQTRSLSRNKFKPLLWGKTKAALTNFEVVTNNNPMADIFFLKQHIKYCNPLLSYM